MLGLVVEDEEEEGDSNARAAAAVAEGVLDSSGTKDGLAAACEAVEL